MHEDEPLLGRNAQRLAIRLRRALPVEDDARAVLARRCDFHERGIDGHDNRRANPESPRVIRNALRVIASRERDDPAAGLLGAEPRQAIARTALLVRARHLEVLELQKHLRPGQLRQGLRVSTGSLGDVRVNDAPRILDILERNRQHIASRHRSTGHEFLVVL